MPKKSASKAKKKDQWPDDEDTEQQLTENMKKLMSDVSFVALSTCQTQGHGECKILEFREIHEINYREF